MIQDARFSPRSTRCKGVGQAFIITEWIIIDDGYYVVCKPTTARPSNIASSLYRQSINTYTHTDMHFQCQLNRLTSALLKFRLDIYLRISAESSHPCPGNTYFKIVLFFLPASPMILILKHGTICQRRSLTQKPHASFTDRYHTSTAPPKLQTPGGSIP